MTVECSAPTTEIDEKSLVSSKSGAAMDKMLYAEPSVTLESHAAVKTVSFFWLMFNLTMLYSIGS